MRRMIPLVLALSVARSVAMVDDPKGEEGRAVEAVALAKKEAARYRISRELETKSGVFELNSDVLLQWSNPVAGSIHGAVFVWTDRGVPVVVSSIYKWFSPNHHMGVEFHALTGDRVTADRDGKPLWAAAKPGVARKPITGAPAPASTPSGRLRQIRALAKEFAATQTTREGVTRDLRLLTQPLYRYESRDPDVIDGGLFAFVQGTDPEVILLIEARTSPDGPRWEFAAARMNSIDLRLSHKGGLAWSAPTIPWAQARDRREPYALFIYDPDPGMGPGDGPPTR